VILFMLSACQDGVVSSGNQLCCWRTSLGFPCSGAGGAGFGWALTGAFRCCVSKTRPATCCAGPGAVENRSGAREMIIQSSDSTRTNCVEGGRLVASYLNVTGRSDCYLVDPASGHMLVSKIKPCMSKHSW
jgi:hypothetical protein